MRIKSFFLASTLAGLCLAGGPAMSAGFDQATLIKPVKGPITIIFVPKVVHPWYEVVEAGAKAAAEEFSKDGVTVNVVMDAPPVADITEHLKKIEAAVSRRPEGLAVACLDPASDTQAIRDALKTGLAVSTFDTDCPDSGRIMYVGHNKDLEDGYELGKFLAAKVGEKGKVGVLSGSLSAPNHKARVTGFKKAIGEFPNMQVAFDQPDNDDLQKAADLTENALQANPDLVGIFGSNASAPIGAARAVENASLKGKVHIVGMDDLPEAVGYLKSGTIDALKAQRQWEIGYWTVKYFVAMTEGHTFPREHATGSQILTADKLK
jgi:ribose transport system substrate-binding protein